MVLVAPGSPSRPGRPTPPGPGTGPRPCPSAAHSCCGCLGQLPRRLPLQVLVEADPRRRVRGRKSCTAAPCGSLQPCSGHMPASPRPTHPGRAGADWIASNSAWCSQCRAAPWCATKATKALAALVGGCCRLTSRWCCAEDVRTAAPAPRSLAWPPRRGSRPAAAARSRARRCWNSGRWPRSRRASSHWAKSDDRRHVDVPHVEAGCRELTGCTDWHAPGCARTSRAAGSAR
jgi:hypothetical protein